MEGRLEQARRMGSLGARLAARIPWCSRYLKRELWRELDELVRRHAAERLDGARRQVAAVARGLGLKEKSRLGRLDRLGTGLDTLAQRLRAAGAGYGGLFDALKVGERELERLYELDLDLTEEAEALEVVACRREGAWEDELERRLERLGASLDARSQVVRPVGEGGRSR